MSSQTEWGSDWFLLYGGLKQRVFTFLNILYED